MELLAELKGDKGFYSLLRLKHELRKMRLLSLDLTLSYPPSIYCKEVQPKEEMKQAKADLTIPVKPSR